MQYSPSLKSLVLAIGLVLSAAAPAVLARPGHEMHRMHEGAGPLGGRHLMHMLDEVKASDAQREQIRAIFKAAHEELKGQREQRQALHKQLLQALAAPNVDAAAIEALRKQKLSQHDQASARMSRALVDAARVLSPEQRAQLAEKMGKRMERMRERMQRHDGA